MATNIYGFPKQKVSNKKKDEEFHILCAEALIKEAAFNSMDKAHIKSLFDAANNEIDDKTYRYVTNPYNSNTFKKVNFPAKIRNYPILSPILNLMMGEKAKRPKNYQVVATNADSVTQAQTEQFQAALELYKRVFINELNKIEDTGIPDQDVEQPKQVLAELSANPADKRAIVGQEALDYIIYDNEVIHQFQKTFYDYMVGGSGHTFKDVVHDNIIYEDVSIMDLSIRKAPETEFTEDGESVVRRKLLTVSQVIDRFYDLLKPHQIDELENPSQHKEGGFFTPFTSTVDNTQHLDERLIEVLHCVWKSFKKIGILSYIDENGIPAQMEVDEDYELSEGEEIHWIWVSEVRQCYRVDNKFYLDWGVIPVQRGKLDDLSACKLPYNGIFYSDRHSKNKSLVEIGLPYQILYNVFHYRFENTMAKNKDKMTLIPIDAIPKLDGWDVDKFMYYADAMGFVFIDPTAEGAKGFAGWQVLDASLSQYAKVMIDLMTSIRLEWEETVGITRQRKGETSASETATANQEAVFRSSVITEEIFRKFEKFEERELQGLLDLSKIAWVNGKKAMYVNSDMRTAILNIDPIMYTETEMAVFVRNSGKESEKFELIKQLSQAALQNGLPMSSFAEVLEANNFSKVKDLLRKGEEAQAQMEQQTEQARMQMEQQIAQLEMELKMSEIQEGDKQRAHDAEQGQLDRQNKIDVELIKASVAKGQDMDVDDDGIPDAVEMLKINNERLAISIDDKHKKRELDIKQQDANTKEKDVDQKVKIEQLKIEQEKMKIEKSKVDIQKTKESAKAAKVKGDISIQKAKQSANKKPSSGKK
jgi:hypothetical protein